MTRPPPPSLRIALLDDRPLVVALHVLQPRFVEQRPERPVDHPVVPVPDVGVGPHDDVAARREERLPERLALAAERAVARQHVGVLDDPRALGLGDLARPVGRRGVDDEDLVEQRHAPDHLAHAPAHDRADRLLLVERRQDQRDRDALLLLELDEPPEVGELGVVEVRFAEPALDAGGDGARLLGGTVGGDERLRLRCQLSNVAPPISSRVLTTTTEGLARARDRLGQRPEQVRVHAVAAGHRRRAHHDEVRLLGLAQDGVADVRRLAQDGLALALEVLLDERREGPFRLRPDGHRDARRDEVEHDDRRAVVGRDRVGEADRQLGVGTAADRHEDTLDLA